MATKKSNRKWNRVHYFKRKKSNVHKGVGHPVYVYGKSGKIEKGLLFTHKPVEGQEDDFVELKHNIDPEEEKATGKKPYVKTKPEIFNGTLRDPDKKYRIHKDDTEIIKGLKK